MIFHALLKFSLGVGSGICILAILMVYWPGLAPDIYENARRTGLIYVFTPYVILQLIAAVVWLYFDCVMLDDNNDDRPELY